MKTIAYALFATLAVMTSSIAFADCAPIYANLYETALSESQSVGAESSLGVTAGGVVWGVNPRSAPAGLLTTTGSGVAYAIRGSKAKHKAKKLEKIVRLYNEVEIKEGLLLQSISEDLSAPVDQIAAIFTNGSQQNVFCQGGYTSPYTYEDILKFVQYSLKK
jgi:hypothetical protein